MQAQPWIIVVDGGGSKIATAACRASQFSRHNLPETLDGLHQRAYVGTGSAHPATWTEAAVNLTSALTQEMAELGQRGGTPALLYLALAGAGRSEDQLRVVEHVRRSLADTTALTSDTVIRCSGDIDPLIDSWDNTNHSHSIAIILGTGSIVATRADQGEMIRAGGWGPNLGDECSGAAVGIAGLRLLVRQLDMGLEPDQFAALPLSIARQLALDNEWDAALSRPWLSSAAIQAAADRTRAARYSLIVAEAAYHMADASAVELLRSHVDAVVWQIQQVARRAGRSQSPLMLVFGGGLAQRCAELRNEIISACALSGLTIASSTFADPLLATLRAAVRSMP